MEDGAGGLCAGKVFHSNSIEETELRIKKEAKILSSINSDKVIKLHSPEHAETSLCHSCPVLPLEYCEGGELYDYLQIGRFPDPLARFYFRSLVEAVAACHSCGIAHCDLKLENFLLNSDFQVKLADFGLATVVGDCRDGLLEAHQGTISYMAPEIQARMLYDGFAADIFALGVCLFAMCTKAHPFKSATSSDNHYRLFLHDNSYYWAMYSQLTGLAFSFDFIDLINSLLALNPTHRLSLSEIFAHPWMQGPIASDVVLQMSIRRAANVRAGATQLQLEADQSQAPQGRCDERVGCYNKLVDELLSNM
jgi:5'-AMP-activated protein kinase catalytic alpha subunit